MFVHRNLTTAEDGQAGHRRRHRRRASGVGGPDHHAVVGVVPHGRGEGPSDQAETLDPAQSDPSAPPVTLDHGQPGDPGPGAEGSVTRDRVVSDPDSMPMVRARFPGVDRSVNAAGPGGTGRWTEWRIHSGAGTCGTAPGTADPSTATRRPACHTRAGRKPSRRSKQAMSALVPGGQRAQLGEPVILGWVGGGQHQRIDLRYAGRHGQGNTVVEMAGAQQGVGLPVVGAERHVVGPVAKNGRDQGRQVLAGRALAHEDPHALAPLLLGLRQLGALVVGLDTGG